MGIKTKLFKHQSDLVEHIKAKTFWAILFEPGLGKTLAALAVVTERVARDPSYRTLVVVPNTLVDNWAAEITKHTDLTYELLIGSRQQREKKLFNAAHLYIINYEGARTITDSLTTNKFNLMICDESHALKNHASLQSKACYKIAQNVPHRIIMTGTPILNCPLDVYGQYRTLSTEVFGQSYYRFRNTYAIMGGYMNKQVTKYIHMEDFKRRALMCSTIKTKDECLDLPDKLYETVHLDLPEAQMKMYKALRESFIAEFKDRVVTAPVVLTRLIRFSQITAGFYKDIGGEEHEFETNPKQDWLVQWVQEHQKKVVVFCRFTKEIHMLEARLKNVGLGFVTVDGASKDRIKLVNQFNEDPAVRVFVGQIDVAGQGINLTGASHVLFLSNNYSYGDRVQAEDRIHRIGQTNNCTYIDVVYRSSVDAAVLRVLQKKENLASMLSNDIIKLV